MNRLLLLVCLLIGLAHVTTQQQPPPPGCSVWNGTVLISDFQTIPSGTCVFIQDHTVVSFYETWIPVATIKVEGQLLVGRNVTFQSLSFYDGTWPTNAQSLDNWQIQFTTKSQQEDILLHNVTFQKNIPKDRLSTPPTLIFEKPFRTNIVGCKFHGGSIALGFVSPSSLPFQNTSLVFAVVESDFTDMYCASMFDGYFFNGTFARFQFNGCKFVRLVKAISNDVIQESNQELRISNSIFTNISRVAIESIKSPVVIEKSSIQNYVLAVRSNQADINDVTFDNLHTTYYGETTVVNRETVSKIRLSIKNSRFLGIKGEVVLLKSAADWFEFYGNVVSNCSYVISHESMIDLSSTVDFIVISNNSIRYNDFKSYLRGYIIYINSVKNLRLVHNDMSYNIAYKVLKMVNVESNAKIVATQNIFDNYTPGTNINSVTLKEVSYDRNDYTFNFTFNYWGTNVSLTSGMSSSNVNNAIESKLEPPYCFRYVPYLLTRDVNNMEASNLGGFIPVASSSSVSKPTSDATQLAIIIGSVVGSVFALGIAFVIITVIVLCLIRKRKRSATSGQYYQM